MNRNYVDWLAAAKDDLDTVVLLLAQSHLSNILSFHAHQCVEKSLKAVIEKYSTEPQKTHNLERLYSHVEKFVQLHIDELMLEKVSELYIESRYPGDLGLLPN
ncbi:MAG: HEPN domain-containing protein, partial [Pseudomonadota bacterium]|nr:HEPN domain-containing protein [Pseudomonadota bacterium]